MKDRRMRAPIAQARGLGSARDGSAHWRTQRVTAVALVPLTVWFMCSLIALTGGDHTAFVIWLQFPLNTVLMATFVIAVFYHMALGLQVVVEDYLHTARTRIPAVVAIHTGCAILVITGLISVIRIVV